MSNSRHRCPVVWAAAIAFTASSLTTQIAWAQENIGNAEIVVNDVRGVLGQSEPTVLHAGIDVFQNEVVRTGEKSASKVLFQDHTTLSVGASSEVTLDRFVFDPDPQKSQVALSIAKGVVRFATGSLPKSAYKISTPTATIGIRGTILSITVAADGETAISVEEGAAVVTAAGQAVTVESGMTTTTSSGAPPSTPSPTPPSPPAPVSEMDAMLSQGLAPGAAAGVATASVLSAPVIAVAVVAVIVGVTVAVTSGGGSTTTSH